MGAYGEDAACAYLSRLSYTILERNVRTPFGEIDIVARDQDTIVCVEVKSRTSILYGTPAEAITLDKMRHMQRAALSYISSRGTPDVPVRLDVITVLHQVEEKTPEIRHIKNVSL